MQVTDDINAGSTCPTSEAIPAVRQSARFGRSKYGEVYPGLIRGELTVLRISTAEDIEKYGVLSTPSKTTWLVRCSCGTHKNYPSGKIVSKIKTPSCGCARSRGFVFSVSDTADATSRACRTCFLNYRATAKKIRGLEWELTFKQFRDITALPCAYCGQPPSNKYKAKYAKKAERVPQPFIYSGIDRVDSSKGYIHGNIVPCCWNCNASKKHRPKAEFLSWIESAYRTSIDNALLYNG